jgi:hypothetical protein
MAAVARKQPGFESFYGVVEFSLRASESASRK